LEFFTKQGLIGALFGFERLFSNCEVWFLLRLSRQGKFLFVRIGIVRLDGLQLLDSRDDFSYFRVHKLLVITTHALPIKWAFFCGFMMMVLNDLKKWET
jgi:hypothetical protein